MTMEEIFGLNFIFYLVIPLKKAKIITSALFPRAIKITNFFPLLTKLVSIETMRKGKFLVLSSERMLESD